jgi:hypothetical protein
MMVPDLEAIEFALHYSFIEQAEGKPLKKIQGIKKAPTDTGWGFSV